MYNSIYTKETPRLIEQLINTTSIQRLHDIGMHCGVEYTSLPIYQQQKLPYSRLIHSIGVAQIVWNFTHDIKQAIAGLLHDIATPVFAHTIDFLHGDYLTQESTEDKTLYFIENSKEITTLLKEFHIGVSEVANYHIYPIADNDTPMLSADRLEYTLGNGYCVYHMDLSTLNGIYSNIIVTKNEHGVDELCFQSVQKAKEFAEISLRNSFLFISDEDRFSMQYLADIMKLSLKSGVLTQDDFYLTESQVICKLKNDNKLSDMWNMYTKINSVKSSDKRSENQYSINVDAKKRFIDPLVLINKKAERLSDIDGDIKIHIQNLLSLDFNKWIYIA